MVLKGLFKISSTYTVQVTLKHFHSSSELQEGVKNQEIILSYPQEMSKSGYNKISELFALICSYKSAHS